MNKFTKIGLSKLMKPFENSPDDLYKLIRAFSVAFNLHAGLSRNNNRNDPYINHCIRVSLILSEEICCKDVNALSAALLHDVFEKTRNPSYDSTRLLADFGKDIGNIILTLSRNRLEDRKAEYLRHYFEKIATSPKITRYVMLADRLDNARFLKNVSQRERAFRYKEETEKYVVPIAQATDERFAIKLSIALYEIK
ncbi:MAG TPA: HD domain-containing protein [Nitrososphaeraceae archaeon]|nr:HD domain-containing protein [Nitrososphaeraceae archaeon]